MFSGKSPKLWRHSYSGFQLWPGELCLEQVVELVGVQAHRAGRLLLAAAARQPKHPAHNFPLWIKLTLPISLYSRHQTGRLQD